MKGVVMLNYLKKEANLTYTEKGALTYRSTMSHCLDLFYRIGAFRNVEEKVIIDQFIKAYTENADLAMRILFYASTALHK